MKRSPWLDGLFEEAVLDWQKELHKQNPKETQWLETVQHTKEGEPFEPKIEYKEGKVYYHSEVVDSTDGYMEPLKLTLVLDLEDGTAWLSNGYCMGGFMFSLELAHKRNYAEF